MTNNEHSRLALREIRGQLRSIRRLCNQVTDDLGDASLDRDNPEAKYAGELCDMISEFEGKLASASERLGTASEKSK